MWHYECNGQSVGPVSEETVNFLIRDGAIIRSTLVWKTGMSGWAHAGDTDLLQYFDTPPPLATGSGNARSLTDDPPTNHMPSTEHRVAQIAMADERTAATSSASEATRHSALMSEPSQRPYREVTESVQPLGGMTKHAQVAVIVFILAAAVAIVSDVLSIGFIVRALSGGFQSETALNSQAMIVDSFSGIAAIAFLIVFLWSAVVIGRWTYRAMKNLRAVGYETSVSPAWTVGWHFIPVALLWMPFRGMAQIWRGSIHGAPTGNNQLPTSMRLWWASWLIGNWASYGAFQMQETGLRTDDFDLVQSAMGVGILGSGLHIVSALLLLGVMKKVTQAQSDQPAMHFN